MKIIQALVGALALAVAGLQCYYLFGIGRWTTNMQPLTTIFYILFFWILWGYARIDRFISPLLIIHNNLVKLLASIAVFGPIALAFYISSISDAARISMMSFGVLNGAIMICYFLVAIISIFGDKWLGFMARILKLGRKFSNKDEGGH